MLGDLRNAIAWIEGNGVPVNPQSRYCRHIKSIEEYERERQSGRSKEARLPHRTIEVAFLEASQLARIWRGLGSQKSKGLTDALRLVVKGPVLPEDESVGPSSNRPRNIAFELDLLATVGGAGTVPVFQRDGDFSFLHDAIPHLVECKRPQNLSSVRKNLDEAAESIRVRRFRAGRHTRGIVGVSIAKALSPARGLFLATDLAELRSFVREELARFWNLQADVWMGLSDSEGVAAVVLQLDYVARVGVDPLWTGCELFTVGRSVLPAEELRSLRRLVDHVRAKARKATNSANQITANLRMAS